MLAKRRIRLTIAVVMTLVAVIVLVSGTAVFADPPQGHAHIDVDKDVDNYTIGSSNHFGVKAQSPSETVTGTISGEGSVRLEVHYAETYTITETSMPDGFQFSSIDHATLTFSQDDISGKQEKDAEIHNSYAPSHLHAHLTIDKTVVGAGAPSGASFSVRAESGGNVYSGTVSAGGSRMFEVTQSGTYTISETVIPEHFELLTISSGSVTISSSDIQQGGNKTVTITNWYIAPTGQSQSTTTLPPTTPTTAPPVGALGAVEVILTGDPEGWGYGDAAVVLTGTGGVQFSGSMESDGDLFVPNVPPGTYSVTISAPGYSPPAGTAVVSAGGTAVVTFVVASSTVVPGGVVQTGGGGMGSSSTLLWLLVGLATVLAAFLVAVCVKPLRKAR